ncbi:MAG: ATPase [Candidatus Lokiarchaeota archaeon]|nr:ATPase [Candidatus Lokiarchaeota archaeon]
MKTKQKFYLLLALFQIVLVFTVFLSTNGIIGIAAAQGTNYDYFNTGTSAALAIGAALAMGMSVLGAGLAIKTVGTAAISAVSEREGTFTKAFLIVALAEALAIYGLIVAVLLWNKIPSPI